MYDERYLFKQNGIERETSSDWLVQTTIMVNVLDQLAN